MLKVPLNIYSLEILIKNKTNGILIAIEKAVIFLLAVIPFRFPEEIAPVDVIMPCASIITA